MLPVFGTHVARIDWRLELQIVDMVIEHLDLRHILHQMREIEGRKRLRHRVLDHADGASGIYDKDTWLHGSVDG